MAVTVTAVLLMLWLAVPDRPEPGLVMAAAAVAATSGLRSRALRLLIMTVAIGGVTYVLHLAGHYPTHLVGAVVLLGSIGYLASALARDLQEAAAAEWSAARAAARRASLLDAVRQLPRTTEAAAEATVETLREFGFDTAVIATVRGNLMLPVVATGAYAPGPLSISDGVLGHAISSDRTIVVGDYRTDPRRLPGAKVYAVVAAVVRVDGRPVGGVVAARSVPGQLSPEEVEAVEVMADHLGYLMGNDRRVQRRRELLARMNELDRMRHSFVGRVSEQLARPLAEIRDLAECLCGPDADDDDRRDTLLEDLNGHAQMLGMTIDALLDFSRFQAGRSEPEPRPITVASLVAPVLRGTEVRLDPAAVDVEVVVDARLARQALELLLSMTSDGSGTFLDVLRRSEGVDLQMRCRRLPAPGDAPREIIQALAGQLLVAAGGGVEARDNTVVLRFPAGAQAGPS